MQTCNRLRIDPGDGSPALDYRIENGRVECRVVDRTEGWRPLSPQQLSLQVKSRAILAHWLSRRMGVFPLVRACSRESDMEGSVRSDEAA